MCQVIAALIFNQRDVRSLIVDNTISTPVSRGISLKLLNPLPKYLQDIHVEKFLGEVTKPVAVVVFMKMLRAFLFLYDFPWFLERRNPIKAKSPV